MKEREKQGTEIQNPSFEKGEFELRSMFVSTIVLQMRGSAVCTLNVLTQLAHDRITGLWVVPKQYLLYAFGYLDTCMARTSVNPGDYC